MSAGETWLVTGANGCIGAWTALTLLRQGVRVVGLGRSEDSHRRRLIFEPDELDLMQFVRGDVADLGLLERTMKEHAVTHVVHLAALQVPFCRADPPLGAHVNVEGTAVVFEAARRHGLTTPVSYASSAAVYDADGDMNPANVYGIYKIACEGIARIFWQDHGVASVGLRPLVVYGAGRDQGMTAGPTEAIGAAVRGRSHHISFGGRTQLQYAPDVASAFVAAARESPAGAPIYNLGGPDIAVADAIATIRDAVPGAEIGFDDVPLPFPPRLPEPVFETATTPFAAGVRETVEIFCRQAASEQRELEEAG